MKLSLKRLTRNDVSWLEPNARSHQCAINLPIKSFGEMFQDIIRLGEGVHRVAVVAHWYRSDGTKLFHGTSNVAYYHSKREVRLLEVPREDGLRGVLKEGHLLLFKRQGNSLHITHAPPGNEHLVTQLGRRDLVDRLPRR